MLHRSALEDDAGPFHSRSPSGSKPSPRADSRSSRSASRVRIGGFDTPGFGVSQTVNLVPDGLRSSSPIKEGLGSLNRWSQSTTSSRSPSESADHHQHQRATSKATIGHSPRNTGTELNELPELNVPELRASEMFSQDSSHLDLSFTASSHVFQNSAQNDPYDYEATHTYSHDFNAARASEGASSTEGDMDIDSQQHGLTQKTMLSKALQKANTAVLLDNAANFEGAMEAYTDACQLLQLVMLRSNGGDEEKLKLQEIRDTYMIRITELERMEYPLVQDEGKALPERPLSQESYDDLFHLSHDDPDRDSQYSSTHSSVGLHTTIEDAKVLAPAAIPPRRQSLRPSSFEDQTRAALGLPRTIQSDRSTPVNDINHRKQSLDTTVEDNNETTSWLDTIDESGASSPSSANSKGSSVYMRRRLSRQLNVDIESKTDAAPNAAYDDDLAPVHEYREEDEDDDVVANAHRNIELAKRRVREAELEAEVAMNRGRQMRRLQAQNMLEYSEHHPDPDYLDEEAEEEERILEEMTQGFVMDDFEFDIQSKSALPRESDSSNISGRTWESSGTGAGTTLSTLTEDEDILPPDQRIERNTLIPSSPPSAALPPLPASSDFPGLPAKRISVTTFPPPASDPPPVPSVRERRISTKLSRQTTQELKIETNTSHPRADSNISDPESFTIPPTSRLPPPLPKYEAPSSPEAARASAPGLRPQLSLSPSQRNLSIGSISEQILAKAPTNEDDEAGGPPLPRVMSKVLSAPDGLNKSGTKPFRSRNVSVPNPEMPPVSPITPWSTLFPTMDAAMASMTGIPPLPTPTVASFSQNGLPTSGLNLFDCNIHSPTDLGSGNASVANAPNPLEPCPESFLLRPFWLMRCLYQTVAHPHGGYLSAKLFIPRDVWRVKNVKLKAVEDKVSNCDLLTAALLKLAQVDTYDADAVLEEMQSLEGVLDQVQTTLSKKLGSDVGVQTAMPLFRPNNPPDDPSHPEPPPSRVSGSSNKFTSWKRLRNKTSGISTPTPTSSVRESNKDMLTLSSLPMTSVHIPQTKRAVTQIEFSGPNAHYMGALARLFDAAQVIDQIAQQVEDPGLRLSSQTHVGLELSTRHAAEFFGFYVCRFALADITLMLDKFIKRGSEWVLV
ncbi:hypothetical protein N7495_008851 [Penicillium taxi]|uniref:uncharacterized protein n=1 Tax=Penicillium taxi TaxID=168475 RepID=UPI002545301F|nr:uncharacterized protein N7495_008851 [Penicillium taxi]KAJ5888810.1 hypothetical protein N7495_008851 [Penicillium taxi]